MHQETQLQSPAKFILAILGLTAFAMLVTTAVCYIGTSAPRGFMFWIIWGFLCTSEFLVGILAVNVFARTRCEFRPSGAILSITYGAVVGFAATSLLSILVYYYLRDDKGSSDHIFTAFLVLLTAIWFIAVFVLYANDLHSQSVSRSVTEGRETHRQFAEDLKPILVALRKVHPENYEIRKRLDAIVKNLEVVSTATSHSHGGGIGSWEGGNLHRINPEQEQIILAGIANLTGTLRLISSDSSPEWATVITQLEQSVVGLTTAVSALGLE